MSAQEKYFEQLRTVHFALLTASFALLVAASLAPKGDLNRAADEATTVARLNVILTRDRINEVCDRHNAKAEGGLVLHAVRLEWVWRVDNVFHPLRESYRPMPTPRVWIPLDNEAFSPAFNVPEGVSADTSRRTVRQFRDVWRFLRNGLHGVIVVRAFPARTTFRDGEGSRTDQRTFDEELLGALRPDMALDYDREFLTNVRVERSMAGDYYALLQLNGGKIGDAHVRFNREAVVPLEVRAHPVPLLADVLRDAGMAADATLQYDRDFDSVFRHTVSLLVAWIRLRSRNFERTCSGSQTRRDKR